MKPFFRMLVVAFLIYATVISMKFLQQAFDEGDMRRARESFNRLQISDKTVWQLMADDLHVKKDDVRCDEFLLSRYSGPIRFECYAAEQKDQKYIWEVDVVGFRVTPANPLTIKLTEGHHEKN